MNKLFAKVCSKLGYVLGFHVFGYKELRIQEKELVNAETPISNLLAGYAPFLNRANLISKMADSELVSDTYYGFRYMIMFHNGVMLGYSAVLFILIGYFQITPMMMLLLAMPIGIRLLLDLGVIEGAEAFAAVQRVDDLNDGIAGMIATLYTDYVSEVNSTEELIKYVLDNDLEVCNKEVEIHLRYMLAELYELLDILA